ncbi:hypothetical protein BU15DRAFT_62126 [Melanogaster broomeanus]|nr:hypothetical protein BU15DRAFT_62126 [Melanogaster broomeanus]
MPQKRKRVEFTREHDSYLLQYLAKYSPSTQGRSGTRLYQILEANEDRLWPWAVHHSWQSWRERYVVNSDHFDRLIAREQKLRGPGKPPKQNSAKPIANGRRPAGRPVNVEKTEMNAKRKRVADRESEHADAQQAKRPRVDPSGHLAVAGSGNSSALPSEKSERVKDEKRRSQVEASTVPSAPNGDVPAKSTATPSKSVPLANGGRADLARNGPSQGSTAVVAEGTSQGETHTLDEPLPTAQPRPPSPSHDTSNVETTATASTLQLVEKPTSTVLDLPTLRTRNDTLVLPSSSPEKPPSQGGQDADSPGESRSTISPRRQKSIRKRPRTPSELFASVPPSPRRVSPEANVASSSRRADESAPGVSDLQPVAPTYPRAPPRVAETFFGQVLVDQMGRVPRVYPAAAHDSEEDEDEKLQWPPTRGHSARGNGKGKEQVVPGHHPFSQLQPEMRNEVAGAPHIREEKRSSTSMVPDKIPHPFGQVGQTPRRDSLDALDTTKRAPQKPEVADMDRRSIATRFLGRNGRDAAQPPETKGGEQKEKQEARDDPSLSERVPLPASPHETLIAPIQRHGSKSSKFPAPRASTRSPFRLPEPPRPQSTSRTVHHPALARVRGQTIGRGREVVPSVDLVAKSSSTSIPSMTSNRSSTSGSGRPQRWSLPAHTTPPLFREGGSSLFRWPVPSPFYTDTDSLTSAPSLPFARTFTPSPDSTSHTGTSPRLTPHPADLPLTASHGLASILAHMSANHGLAPSVVQAVYSRVGSLREADDVLRGMREAAEGFGEAEIERRTSLSSVRDESVIDGKTRRTHTRRASEGARLHYVPASEDGELSEYSPPASTRAAMWKRVSDDVAAADLEVGGDVEDVCGVGEEFRENDAGDETRRLPELHHDFSQQIPSHEVSQPAPGAEVTETEDTRGPEHDAWEEHNVEALLVNEEALQLEQRVGKDKGKLKRESNTQKAVYCNLLMRTGTLVTLRFQRQHIPDIMISEEKSQQSTFAMTPCIHPDSPLSTPTSSSSSPPSSPSSTSTLRLSESTPHFSTIQLKGKGVNSQDLPTTPLKGRRSEKAASPKTSIQPYSPIQYRGTHIRARKDALKLLQSRIHCNVSQEKRRTQIPLKIEEILSQGLSHISQETFRQAVLAKEAARETRRHQLLTNAWEIEETKRYTRLLELMNEELEHEYRNSEAEYQLFQSILSDRPISELVEDRKDLFSEYDNIASSVEAYDRELDAIHAVSSVQGPEPPSHQASGRNKAGEPSSQKGSLGFDATLKAHGPESPSNDMTRVPHQIKARSEEVAAVKASKCRPRCVNPVNHEMDRDKTPAAIQAYGPASIALNHNFGWSVHMPQYDLEKTSAEITETRSSIGPHRSQQLPQKPSSKSPVAILYRVTKPSRAAPPPASQAPIPGVVNTNSAPSTLRERSLSAPSPSQPIVSARDLAAILDDAKRRIRTVVLNENGLPTPPQREKIYHAALRDSALDSGVFRSADHAMYWADSRVHHHAKEFYNVVCQLRTAFRNKAREMVYNV